VRTVLLSVMSSQRNDIGPLAVVVFGDGTLPEVLLTCMQFRLVVDKLMTPSSPPMHLMQQLRSHIERTRCPSCRGYFMGRMLERRLTRGRDSTGASTEPSPTD
jgi:hypothetical protein